MSADSILIVRRSRLREVTENEVLAELTTEELRLPQEVYHIDTRLFIDNLTDENWQTSENYLINQAGEVRRLAKHLCDPLIKYYGLAEIAHVFALSAFIGDEWPVLVFDLTVTLNTGNVWFRSLNFKLRI